MKKSLGAKTLLYPTPVLLVGTYDKNDRPNLAAVAWGGVCCSQPPCVAVSLRAATYTHGNIKARGAFTVNVPSESQIAEADFCGTASGKTVDKFTKIKFTPVKSSLVDAPYGEEFALVLECKVIHTIEIGLHTEFIGEIMDVKAEEGVLGDNGYPDVAKLKPMVYAPGSQTYYGVGKRLAVAYNVGKKVKG